MTHDEIDKLTGRELDAAFAEALGQRGTIDGPPYWRMAQFSRSLDAVIAALPDEWRQSWAPTWVVTIDPDAHGAATYSADGPTPATALCRAALKAKGHGHDPDCRCEFCKPKAAAEPAGEDDGLLLRALKELGWDWADEGGGYFLYWNSDKDPPAGLTSCECLEDVVREIWGSQKPAGEPAGMTPAEASAQYRLGYNVGYETASDGERNHFATAAPAGVPTEPRWACSCCGVWNERHADRCVECGRHAYAEPAGSADDAEDSP